jgi:tol-pal system protein YbgF
MIPTMRLRRLLPPATALVLVLATAPAFSQTPMTDPLDIRDARRLDRMEKVVRELRAIVFQGRDIGKPVVVQPAETDYQVQELTRRVNDLEQTLRRVNGQLETVSNDLAQSRRASEAAAAQTKALQDRLAAMEQQGAPPPPQPGTGTDGTAPPPPAADSGVSPTDAFAQTRQQMLSGDYDGAERGWQDFVARYSDHPKAPEARYWLGKTLGVRGAHNEAAASYIQSIRGWPQAAWAPDAVVELSRELVALKKPAEACQMLAEFDRRYPKAVASVKARAVTARTQAKCA